MGINTNIYKSVAAFGDAAATAARQSSKAARHAAVAEKLTSAKSVATKVGLVGASAGLIGGSAVAGYALPRGFDHLTGWYSTDSDSTRRFDKLVSGGALTVVGACAAAFSHDDARPIFAAAIGVATLTSVVSIWSHPIDEE